MHSLGDVYKKSPMKCTGVTYAEGPWYVGYHVWFECNGFTWSKDFPDAHILDPKSIEDFVNSVLEDQRLRG